ncbi:hypothetical protein PVK06_011415 [Gossypium arboreum]|uniref:Uncharacterized protein n=1 Tax=Gossypium arboreum TaxID=29729 RepID=A0ABR0Q9J8_GOSAR|nr:hypothetical protein PVK06_011415 [Gossypium arboreum]
MCILTWVCIGKKTTPTVIFSPPGNDVTTSKLQCHNTLDSGTIKALGIRKPKWALNMVKEMVVKRLFKSIATKNEIKWLLLYRGLHLNHFQYDFSIPKGLDDFYLTDIWLSWLAIRTMKAPVFGKAKLIRMKEFKVIEDLRIEWRDQAKCRQMLVLGTVTVSYKEQTSLDVPLLDVAMNASTLQEYLKQQNKWANLETSNAIPKEMNASFMGFVLRSANEGISQKRVGNSKWPKQKRVRSKTIIVCAYGVHACH